MSIINEEKGFCRLGMQVTFRFKILLCWELMVEFGSIILTGAPISFQVDCINSDL